MLQYTPTPIQEIHDPLLIEHGVRLLIKREDLNHPTVSGNKWWKLKYNLLEAQRLHQETLLTVGGAYSNHIYATAAAAHEEGFKSIGIIRGEETHPINQTLSFAKKKGMEVHYISREEYRTKHSHKFLEELHNVYGDFYFIPEGGTNEFAIKGAIEFAESIITLDFDHLILPVGTGGTITGIILGLEGKRNIIGVSTLKGDFLTAEINNLLNAQNNSLVAYGNWSLLTSYHHGGYAKVTPELKGFMDEMRVKHNLPLDPVYTGKLLWAAMEEVKKGSFNRGSTILALHTGGLQGAISNPNRYEENST